MNVTDLPLEIIYSIVLRDVDIWISLLPVFGREMSSPKWQASARIRFAQEKFRDGVLSLGPRSRGAKRLQHEYSVLGLVSMYSFCGVGINTFLEARKYLSTAIGVYEIRNKQWLREIVRVWKEIFDGVSKLARPPQGKDKMREGKKVQRWNIVAHDIIEKVQRKGCFGYYIVIINDGEGIFEFSMGGEGTMTFRETDTLHIAEPFSDREFLHSK